MNKTRTNQIFDITANSLYLKVTLEEKHEGTTVDKTLVKTYAPIMASQMHNKFINLWL